MKNNFFTEQHVCSTYKSMYVCVHAATLAFASMTDDLLSVLHAYTEHLAQAGLRDGELIYFSPFNKINTHAADMPSLHEIVAVWQCTCVK